MPSLNISMKVEQLIKITFNRSYFNVFCLGNSRSATFKVIHTITQVIECLDAVNKQNIIDEIPTNINELLNNLADPKNDGDINVEV